MYHVNPTTGKVGTCRAMSDNGGQKRRGGCPFGTVDQHHSTAEEARLAYEDTMAAETFVVHKKEIQPAPEVVTPDVEAAQNRSKMKFEFDKADLNYNRAVMLMNDDTAVHNMSSKDLEGYKAERDRLAVALGRPTIDQQESAAREKASADRTEMLKKLTHLRVGVRSNEVGPGTDRGRLYKVEQNLLHQYTMDRSINDDPTDVWALKHSVSNYEVDDISKKLKELGPVTFVSSRDKKDRSADLNQQLLRSSKRRDEAASALGLPQ